MIAKSYDDEDEEEVELERQFGEGGAFSTDHFAKNTEFLQSSHLIEELDPHKTNRKGCKPKLMLRRVVVLDKSRPTVALTIINHRHETKFKKGACPT